MAAKSRRSGAGGGHLSIGAVSRATGLSPDLLRVWQKRYGFPVPVRKPSGHRLFSAVDVRRLRRIAEAVARGHRPAQVVGLSEAKLEGLLAEDQALLPPARRTPVEGLLEHVKNHRRGELVAALLADAATLGPVEFVAMRLGPLADAVGDAWECGETGVHNEHLFSECAEDVLRAVRLPLERDARGPTVIFATLAGESHGLGLQMAALVTAAAGARPHVLGTDTPVDEILEAWVTRNAEAIAISISLSTGGATARNQLARLRDAIPTTVPILVGGRGARRLHPPSAVAVVEDLRRLHDWMRSFRARAS